MSQAAKMRAHPAVEFATRPGIQSSRRLIDVHQTRHEAVEFADNMFVNDLCGQIVRGEVVLVAGAPGSNKSTLARQLAFDLACQGMSALQILTEESAERARSSTVKMAFDMPPSKVREALSNIHVETAISDVEALPNFFASQVLNPHGAYHGVSLVVLDSIQGQGLSASNFSAWQSLIQFFALTRAAQVTTLAICHITKRGEIAGPKALEHAVDCSILMRKAYNRRMVSVLKNRFGPETARPMQLEIDPLTLKLRVSPHAETLTAVARGYLPGFGVTEVQGAVALPKPGNAAKVTAPGLPRKEIEQYLSSGLCQVPGFELADFDLSFSAGSTSSHRKSMSPHRTPHLQTATAPHRPLGTPPPDAPPWHEFLRAPAGRAHNPSRRPDTPAEPPRAPRSRFPLPHPAPATRLANPLSRKAVRLGRQSVTRPQNSPRSTTSPAASS
jgi:KaiC/GvpD/RAD55 family RecA-like ATPase